MPHDDDGRGDLGKMLDDAARLPAGECRVPYRLTEIDDRGRRVGCDPGTVPLDVLTAAGHAAQGVVDRMRETSSSGVAEKWGAVPGDAGRGRAADDRWPPVDRRAPRLRPVARARLCVHPRRHLAGLRRRRHRRRLGCRGRPTGASRTLLTESIARQDSPARHSGWEAYQV
jgi:hypothetical protein